MTVKTKNYIIIQLKIMSQYFTSIEIVKYNFVKPIIFENCIFFGDVQIIKPKQKQLIKNKKIIFINCVFMDNVYTSYEVHQNITYIKCVKHGKAS